MWIYTTSTYITNTEIVDIFLFSLIVIEWMKCTLLVYGNLLGMRQAERLFCHNSFCERFHTCKCWFVEIQFSLYTQIAWMPFFFHYFNDPFGSSQWIFSCDIENTLFVWKRTYSIGYSESMPLEMWNFSDPRTSGKCVFFLL